MGLGDFSRGRRARERALTAEPAGSPGAAIVVLVFVALAALVAAGCGGDDDAEPQPPPAEPPTEPAEPPDADEPPPTGDGRGGIRLRELGSFDQPVHLAQAPGSDHLVVVEQPGRLQLIPDGDGDPREILDLTDRTACCGEQGLLSLAFHPEFERNGRLYLNYTDTAGTTRVVEYRSGDGGRSVAEGSARELLSIEQFAANHNGGLVIFGPDELLYIATGDGGGAGDPERTALDLSSPLGKLLRIDPRRDPEAGREYRIPADNPFAGEPGARDEIVAYGLRNPWRISFDRLTDDVWIADVGQNEWEEVNGVGLDQLEGANFGWSAFEGEQRFNEDQQASGHVPPLHTYPLSEGRCAVTGGHVVRDERLTSLYGRYLYADFCAGELRSFRARAGRPARDDRAVGPTVPSVSSFAEDLDGRLYVVSLEGPVLEIAPG